MKHLWPSVSTDVAGRAGKQSLENLALILIGSLNMWATVPNFISKKRYQAFQTQFQDYSIDCWMRQSVVWMRWDQRRYSKHLISIYIFLSFSTPTCLFFNRCYTFSKGNLRQLKKRILSTSPPQLQVENKGKKTGTRESGALVVYCCIVNHPQTAIIYLACESVICVRIIPWHLGT